MRHRIPVAVPQQGGQETGKRVAAEGSVQVSLHRIIVFQVVGPFSPHAEGRVGAPFKRMRRHPGKGSRKLPFPELIRFGEGKRISIAN